MADQFSGLSQNSAGGTNREHEQALINMGMLPARAVVNIPDGMSYLFDMFLEIRFSVNNENKLVPREALTFLDINQYKECMGVNLSPLEATVLMSADGIYNTQAN